MTPGWVLLQCLRWVVTFGEGPEIFRRVRTRVRTAVGPLFEMLHIYMVLAPRGKVPKKTNHFYMTTDKTITASATRRDLRKFAEHTR